MKKSRFIKYYNELQESFRHHFDQTMHSPEEEAIHLLRVDIKKLRTFWSLMQHVSHGRIHKKLYFDRVCNLFEVAGKLRETHVNRELIEKHPSKTLISYAEYLSNKELEYTSELSNIMQQFDMHEFQLMYNDIQVILEETPYDTLLVETVFYALKKTKKVSKLTVRNMGDKSLHKIRIQQKAMQEILTLIDKLLKDPKLDHLRKEVKELNIHIGLWHDYTVLTKSLNDYQNQINSEESDSLKELIVRIKRLEESEKKIIQDQLGVTIEKQLHRIEVISSAF